MADEKSQMMHEGGPIFKGNKSTSSKARILLIVLAIIAVIILIVGIVLVALASKKKDCNGEENGNKGNTEKQVSLFCEYSEEAKRIGLDDIILRTKKAYYEKLPFRLPNDPDATREDIKKNYSAYNPTPEYIKSVTDAARELYKQVNETKMDSNKLKPRERKAISQLKHFLNTTFGEPFDMNFYAGDWMMGPSFACMQPICTIGTDLKAMFKRLKPENLEDVNLIETKLKIVKEGILRYMENLKMGKLHGMVYSQEACVAGLDMLKRNYLNITLKNETGVLDEDYVKDVLNDDYYSDITEDMKNQWKEDHGGKTVNQSMSDYLVEYMGKPMNQLLRPFARSGHMMQNHTGLDSSYTVGLSKQSNSYQSTMICLCFGSCVPRPLPLRSERSIGFPPQPSIGPDFLQSVSLPLMTSPSPHIPAGLSFSKTSLVCPSA